jgi:hypothetical protein
MNDRHKKQLRSVVDAILQPRGALAQDIRRRILEGKPEPVPGALGSFVRKVSENAGDVTDEDVRALLGAGVSQDEVFECVVAAAMGAGLSRLKKGFAAMGGDP